MSFAWTAPDSCPAAPAVEARIEERLGGPIDVGDHRIVVEVTREGDVFVAHIALDDDDARTLDATSCDDLFDAVAVIVARLASEHRPAPPVPREAPPPVAIAVAHAVSAATPPWRLGARLSGASVVGVLPGVAVGAELAAVGEHGPLSAELAVMQWASRSQAISGLAVDHVDVGLRAAALRVGYRIADLPVRAVVSAEAGSMTGSGETSGSGTWLAVGVGAQAWWQATSRVRIVAGLEADDARERVRFTLSTGMVEYEPGAVSARGTVGVEIVTDLGGSQH